jgi:dynein heavy chain
MQPALDEVQQAVNKAAQMVIAVSKGVSLWNKDRRQADNRPGSASDNFERRNSVTSNVPSESSRSDLMTRAGRDKEPTQMSMVTKDQKNNYFKNVSENKEVSKLASLLSTSINSTKKVCCAVASGLYPSHLWPLS